MAKKKTIAVIMMNRAKDMPISDMPMMQQKSSKVSIMKKAEAKAEKTGNRKQELKLEKKISNATGKKYKGKK